MMEVRGMVATEYLSWKETRLLLPLPPFSVSLSLALIAVLFSITEMTEVDLKWLKGQFNKTSFVLKMAWIPILVKFDFIILSEYSTLYH